MSSNGFSPKKSNFLIYSSIFSPINATIAEEIHPAIGVERGNGDLEPEKAIEDLNNVVFPWKIPLKVDFFQLEPIERPEEPSSSSSEPLRGEPKVFISPPYFDESKNPSTLQQYNHFQSEHQKMLEKSRKNRKMSSVLSENGKIIVKKLKFLAKIVDFSLFLLFPRV